LEDGEHWISKNNEDLCGPSKLLKILVVNGIVSFFGIAHQMKQINHIILKDNVLDSSGWSCVAYIMLLLHFEAAKFSTSGYTHWFIVAITYEESIELWFTQ